MAKNTSGLRFTKQMGTKKKKRKSHPESIVQAKNGRCLLCMFDEGIIDEQYTEEHHIFDGPNRDNSEKYGLKVYLCIRHHREGPDAVHNNIRNMRRMQRLGQQAFVNQIGTRQQFYELFGRFYDEEKDDDH